VLKEYQSKKIGAALMSYALQFGSQKNYEVLWLGVWEHNEKAKLFYKKWDQMQAYASSNNLSYKTDTGWMRLLSYYESLK